MIYQLSSGKAIELSVEQYLDMSDEELKYLDANNYGESIEDPWFGSALHKMGTEEFILEDYIIEDLTSISNEEKLLNPDLDIPFPEE